MSVGGLFWTPEPPDQGRQARRARGSHSSRMGPRVRWPFLVPVALGIGVNMALARLLSAALSEPLALAVAALGASALSLTVMATVLQPLLSRREELAYLTNYDPLTSLLNRHRFLAEMREEMARCLRHGQPCSLLVIDLDNFRSINDVLGHHWGDNALTQVAALVKEQVGNIELVGRLGGDELGIFIPTATAQQAEAVARRILAALPNMKTLPKAMGASIGIATCPTDGTTVEELLAKADVAMSQAKTAGGNRYHHFGAGGIGWHGGPAAVRRLQAALREARFLLYWQPIVHLASRHVTGCEVLLRLRDGERVLTPEHFLPIAEASGMIRDIDRWVIEQAIVSYHLLRQYLGASGAFSLHINVSPITLADESLALWIKGLLQGHRVDPQTIVLEVTETTASTNLEVMSRAMEDLVQAGCRFALDDFGSGYSSLFRLAHLPFAVIKIDGSLVRGVKASAIGQALVEVVVNAAQRLGLETVAEQVEEDGPTLEVLRKLGVDHAQGYALGRPQPLPTGPTSPHS